MRATLCSRFFEVRKIFTSFEFQIMKIALFVLKNPVLAAGLLPALGGVAGVINAIALVVVFGALIGAIVSAHGERNVGGIKTSLTIAGVAALAWLIAQGMFAAGGNAPNITLSNAGLN